MGGCNESIDERKWCGECLDKSEKVNPFSPEKDPSPLLCLFGISKSHFGELGVCSRKIALTFDDVFHRGGVSKNFENVLRGLAGIHWHGYFVAIRLTTTQLFETTSWAVEELKVISGELGMLNLCCRVGENFFEHLGRCGYPSTRPAAINY